MSWMDSCSRPRKSAATPPPLYLTQQNVRYCHTCGRVIGSRKSQAAKPSVSEVKFCSDRCKRHKPKAIDRQIEATFAALLNGLEVPKPQTGDSQTGEENVALPKPHVGKLDAVKSKHKKVKGDPRIVVSCSEVEALVFGVRDDPEKTFGRKKNRARRGVPDGDVWKSVDMEGSDTDPGSVSTIAEEASDHGSLAAESDAEETPAGGISLRVRPPQSQSEVNGSIGGEKGWSERVEETPEMLQKRREGQRKAEEKEMVRQAARRAVVFGLEVRSADERTARKGGEQDAVTSVERRMCEAVMNGAVVEPSFAKGDWAIRWRES